MTRVRQPCWRCELCHGFGCATTPDEAFADLEKHYQSTHASKESK